MPGATGLEEMPGATGLETNTDCAARALPIVPAGLD